MFYYWKSVKHNNNIYIGSIMTLPWILQCICKHC